MNHGMSVDGKDDAQRPWRPNAADWRGLIVICSGMSWDGPWMSHKHIAMQLSQHAPVLFVDPPTSVLRTAQAEGLRSTLRKPRLVQVGPQIARLTPLATPGVSRPGLRELAQLTTRRAVGRAANRLGGDVRAVIVGSFDNLFGAAGEDLRVMYGTDDFVAGGALMDLPSDWLTKQESAQLNRANRIIAVSEGLVNRWSAMGHAVTFVPNGCDAERYVDVESAPLPDDVRLPPPIAGIVGHLSERLDIDYLEAIAGTGHSVLLVGPRQESFEPDRMTRLLARENVQWVGPKPFEAMPSYLHAMKVGLTPYANSSFNRASFPLKTLEYIAAGRPVVSTDLPASRWLATDLISIAVTPGEFAAATVKALNADETDDLVIQRREFAAQHSWQARVRDYFLPLLGLTEPMP
ncbi:glycosyltransferase [Jatrophihabitans sp. DSM 45814]